MNVPTYLRAWVTVPNGQHIHGRFPGGSGGSLLEHRLRDELARSLPGSVTEAVLPYGRADVLTATHAIEVEPCGNWRHGVRQALAYSAQTGCTPGLALFGAVEHDKMLRIYRCLRDRVPRVALWWHDPRGLWRAVGGRTGVFNAAGAARQIEREAKREAERARAADPEVQRAEIEAAKVQVELDRAARRARRSMNADAPA